MEEPNSSQILSYLKGKYLTTTKSESNDIGNSNVDKLPVGEESELSGVEAENKFLVNKLEGIQDELNKWLSVLKSKL